MILEIDAGNTRAKWRLTTAELPAPQAGVVLMQGDPLTDALNVTRSVAGRGVRRIDAVRVSNVRGKAFEHCLREAVGDEWQLFPEFPQPVKECAGVVNGYEDPAKLGVDRWLAMLAAYRRAGRGCCVVDCGTTITVDLISDTGIHQGGYIVPGLVMMKTMLERQSPVLKWEIHQRAATVPGRNTAEAINHGALAMVAGLIDRAITSAAEKVGIPALFLTGGDGMVVQQCLDRQSFYEAELVLDGLQLACIAHGG